MKKSRPAIQKAAGKPNQPVFQPANTSINDWVDKQVIMQKLHISERTLQYYRARNIIPWSKLGGKYFYYLPGLLLILEKRY